MKPVSVEKQEAVVKELWRFADNLHHMHDVGVVATNMVGTRVSLTHIGSALREIMGIFGFDVVELQ